MEMEEDIEGFQNTVYFLQQQLKEQKEKNSELEESLAKYRTDDEEQGESMPASCLTTMTTEITQSSPVTSQWLTQYFFDIFRYWYFGGDYYNDNKITNLIYERNVNISINRSLG